MKISDFEISNHDKLDRILVKLCSLIVRGQRQDQDLGMVAAAVLDPDNRCVMGVNYPAGDGRRVHGERAAIDSYHDQFGAIPPGSIIITTCSPCTENMTERAGINCSDLVDQTGVHKVYAGYQDPTQKFGPKRYHLQITRNPKIQKLCKAFADTFLRDELDEGAAEHVRMVMSSAADLMKQHGFRAVGQLSEKDLDKIAQQTGATLHDVCIILNIDHVDQQLDELSFLGSPCTKDCSGHRAGYAWSQSKGGRVAQSPWSPSFNTGSQLHVDGK
jgi:pyrimidine deaminase RibD-like protein